MRDPRGPGAELSVKQLGQGLSSFSLSLGLEHLAGLRWLPFIEYCVPGIVSSSIPRSSIPESEWVDK